MRARDTALGWPRYAQDVRDSVAKTEEFRTRATDCLTLSEQSTLPRHKELFLRMAQTWLTLADQEHRAAPWGVSGTDRADAADGGPALGSSQLHLGHPLSGPTPSR